MCQHFQLVENVGEVKPRFTVASPETDKDVCFWTITSQISTRLITQLSKGDVMYNEILRFWFEELSPAQWWIKDLALDQLIERRFGEIHHKASICELYTWREEARGRLAEIIVLDQFSRNIYRESPLAFACDPLALSLAQHAISLGADQELPPQQRNFIYLPLMHSESLLIHQTALELYTSNALADNLNFEIRHHKIIEQFGRYPHRNEILGRESTAQERSFLKQSGSSF